MTEIWGSNPRIPSFLKKGYMNLIEKFQDYFYNKTIIWTPTVRIFCDGGKPIIRYIPRFRRAYYAKFWGMSGFVIYFLGREFNFSFGKDVNGLYRKRKL